MNIFRKLFNAIFDHFATKMISIFVAVVLWIVVLSSRNVEIAKEVPLEIVTSPEITSGTEVPEHILFQLSGPKAFRRALIERPEVPIKVNLAGAKVGTVTYNFSPEDIRLPLGVKVLAISPPSIRLKLEPVRYAVLPVRADIRGVPDPGYKIIKAEVKPPQMKLKGSRAQLATITEVVSNPVDITGSKRSVDYPLTFELTHLGIQFEGPPPILRLELEPITPNFRLKNVNIRVLSAHKVKLNENTVTVFIRAAQEDLKLLDHARVFAEIDLRGQKKGKYTSTVKVNTPRSVSVIKVVPDQVEVTLY